MTYQAKQASRELERTGAYVDQINAIADRALMAVYDAAVELGADWADTKYMLDGLDDSLFGTLIPHLIRVENADADTRHTLMCIASPHFLGGAA